MRGGGDLGSVPVYADIRSVVGAGDVHPRSSISRRGRARRALKSVRRIDKAGVEIAGRVVEAQPERIVASVFSQLGPEYSDDFRMRYYP